MEYVERLFWTVMPYGLTALKALANHIPELLLALLGTFVGAVLAFKMERRDRRIEEINRRVAQGNIALFTLYSMFEVVCQFKKDVVDVAPNNSGRWLNMNSTPRQQDFKFGFDINTLSFLFVKGEKQILPDLMLEERRFYALMILINQRAELMRDRIWPRLSAAGIAMSTQQYLQDEIEAIIGPGLLKEAQVLADSLITHTAENVQSLQAAFWKLREMLKEMFPEARFILVKFQ